LESAASERLAVSEKAAVLGKLVELEESAALARWYWNFATNYPR
jgi:hypothetical protein